MRLSLPGFYVALSLSLAAQHTEARSVRDEPYPFASAWNAAIRLIRVDNNCPILERDMDVGYFTFSYRDGARSVPGSVEVVRTTVDGRDAARIIVQIPLMPTYVESMLLNQLGRKLRTEFGEPQVPPRRSPAPEAPSNNVPAQPISPGANLPIIDPNAPASPPRIPEPHRAPKARFGAPKPPR